MKIINIQEVDAFIEHVNNWVIDCDKKELLKRLGIKASVSKRETLIAMSIEPNYYQLVRSGQKFNVECRAAGKSTYPVSLTEFSPKVSERIVKFAKKLDYDFSD